MPRPFHNFGQNISSLAPKGKAGRGPGSRWVVLVTCEAHNVFAVSVTRMEPKW